MIRGIYVSGTDTAIGKTHVSCAVLRALNASAIGSVGMKPVASGCDVTAAGLRNADALDLIDASAFVPDYHDVNPFAFRDPVSPHLAAADAMLPIDLAPIVRAFDRLHARAGFVVVEGVGGWLAPLGPSLMQADIAKALGLPVLLVVGLRLGCLNHALLTARAIAADGGQLVGWIANRIDPSMLRADDNIEFLREGIQAPLLGIVEHATGSASQPPADSLVLALRSLLGEERDP